MEATHLLNRCACLSYFCIRVCSIMGSHYSSKNISFTYILSEKEVHGSVRKRHKWGDSQGFPGDSVLGGKCWCSSLICLDLSKQRKVAREPDKGWLSWGRSRQNCVSSGCLIQAKLAFLAQLKLWCPVPNVCETETHKIFHFLSAY